MIQTKGILISKPTKSELIALGLVLAARVVYCLLIPKIIELGRTIYEKWHHL